MNMKAWRSIDGGKTFEEFHTPHGDNHALWIDPANPDRMIGCDDGGAWVSFNAGESWSTIYNQLTAQFYHVATDDQFPYMVYGSQQDNSSIAVPSRTGLGAINWADCYAPGTAESGYVAPKPGDPNIVYVGAIGSSPGGGESLQRYDHTTKQVQLVNVWPEAVPRRQHRRGPLPVDLPDRVLAPRQQRALRCWQQAVPHDRRGTQLADHQP